MMQSRKTILLLRPLQKRELCDPYKLKLILVQKLHLFCQLQTKSAQHIPDQFGLICRKEQKVTVLSLHGLDKSGHLLFFHKLSERRFHCAVLADGNISQSLGAVALGKLYQLVDLLSWHSSLSLRIDTTNTAAIFQSTFKYCKYTLLHHFGHNGKLHAKADIRLVVTEAVHSFLPG